MIKNIQFVRNIIIFEDYACFLFVSPLAFSSGYENLWDLPNVEAVDWSDMGLSIPGLSATLRPFPAREKRMAISHCSYICMIEQSGSKDPYAAFGRNMAALQRNQVTVVGLTTHMPPLAKIWLLCSVSSAPVAQMKLHECNILYFRTGLPVVKLSQCPYIATKSQM